MLVVFFLIFISFPIISTKHNLRPRWPVAWFPIGASQMACGCHHMCPIVKVMKVHTRRHSSKEVLHCLYFFVEYLQFVFESVFFFVIVNMQWHIVESTFQLAYAEFWRHKQEMCEIYSLQDPMGMSRVLTLPTCGAHWREHEIIHTWTRIWNEHPT
jgi:hypothetical protein